MNQLYNDKDYGITKSQRVSKIKCQLIWLLFEGSLAIFLCVVLMIAQDPNNHYLNEGTDLDEDAKVWIEVYLGVYIIYTFRRFTVIL